MPVSILLVGCTENYKTALQDELSNDACTIVSRSTLPQSLSDVTGGQGIVTPIIISLSTVDASPTAVVKLVRNRWPWSSLLLIDAPSSPRMATAALKAGARDYLSEEDSTPVAVAGAIRHILQRCPSVYPNNPVIQTVEDTSLIGRSDVMKPIFERLEIAVENSLNVLIQGESGTGKTRTTHVIHGHSARRDAPLFLVDCQFLTPDQARTLFLGREHPLLRSGEIPDGWPTFIKDLAGGTVVLEHIDAADGQTQDVIAHALETRAFDLGTEKTSGQSGLRFIGVTSSAGQGAHRDGLFYRIAELPISLPPLRERTEDIVPLALHSLETAYGQESHTRPAFSAKAKTALREHPWPGNVRQLKNVINRSVRLSSTLPLELEDLILPDSADLPESKRLSERVERSVRPPDPVQSSPLHMNAPGEFPRKHNTNPTQKHVDSESFPPGDAGRAVPSLEEVKKHAVKRAYEMYDGDVERAAVALDIGRSTMYRMIKRHDLRNEDS